MTEPSDSAAEGQSLLFAMADQVALKSGQEFYDSLVLFAAQTLHVDHVLIGELRNQRVTTKAYCVNGKLIENITYELDGTPCEDVANRGDCFFPCDIQALFPKDRALAVFDIQSYSGIPILDAKGCPLGLISIMNSKDLSADEDLRFRAILKFFSGRVAYEMERENYEASLTEALREKDFLLAEIHHRVKNNLSLIVAMFGLQLSATREESSRSILRGSINRIMAISHLYEMTYTSATLGTIDVSAYLSMLAKSIIATLEEGNREIALEVIGGDLCLELKKMVPLGIIANEIITNSLKHGLLEAPRPALRIEVRRLGEGRAALVISDNGPGLPSQGGQVAESFGLRMVRDLCEQMSGDFSMRPNDPGVASTLIFNYEDRTAHA